MMSFSRQLLSTEIETYKLTPQLLLQPLGLGNQVLDGDLVHQGCCIGLRLLLHQCLKIHARVSEVLTLKQQTERDDIKQKEDKYFIRWHRDTKANVDALKKRRSDFSLTWVHYHH